jgi:anti-sigma factor RsiW
MTHAQNFDEVTFALFYDDEMSQEESAHFEATLESDPDLLARYQQWVEIQEGLSAHFESLEASYSLEGFTARVMDALPEQATWELEATPPERVISEAAPRDSWVKRLLFPLMLGSLTAAVILMIVDRRAPEGTSQPHQVGVNQDNTTLINDSEVKVTWLEDDDDDSDDSDDGDGI